MPDHDKTKEQLIDELREMRQRLSAMESAEARQERAANELRAGQENFEKIVKGASEGILVADPVTAEFKYANPAVCSMLGYAEDELIGLHISAIHPKEEWEHIQGEFQAIARGEKTHLKGIPCLRKDGTILYANIAGASIVMDGLPRNVGLFSDVTDLKKAEEAAELTNQEWERTFDAISDGIMILDCEHRILRANKAMADCLGMHEQELVGKHCYDLVHGAKEPPVFCPHVKLIADGAEHRAEVTEPRLGATLDVRVSPIRDRVGQIRGSVHLTRDITAHKQAETELRKSRDLLRAIIEATPTPMFGLDLDGNVQIVWNPAAEKMLGWTSEEVMGRPLPSVPVQSTEEFARFRDMIRSGKTLYGVEVSRKRLDGTPIDYSIYASPLHDAKGRISGNIAVLVDVTERKRFEQALKCSEERLRLTLEATQIGIWDWDVKTDQWYASPNYYTMLGYEPRTGPGDRREWLERVHPDDRATVSERIQNVLKSDFREYQYEARLRHADGSYRWQHVRGVSVERDEEGKVTRILGIRMDISDRKRTEEDLRTSEEKYRTLFEESFDGLFITSPGGKILDMNKKGVAMFGYDTKEEILSLDLERDVYAHPPDRQRILSQVNAQGSAEYEVVVKKKSGEEMMTHCALTAVKDERGVITSYRGIIRDITDLVHARLRLENERVRLQTLVRTIPDLVWLKDPDGIYLTCNPRFERFFGAKESDIVGKTDHDFVDAELADFFRDHDRKAMAAGKPSINEEWITFSDDGHRELLETIRTPMYDADGTLIGVLGIGRNITAAREAEAALQEASAYNRSLIEASLDPLVTIDAKGKITDVNKATEGVTGYSRDELVGTDFADYFTDPQKSREGYRRAFTEGVVRDYELQIQHRDGHLTPVMYNASVYHDRSGEIVGLFAAARDITERKMSEGLIQVRVNLLEFAATHPLDELLQKTLDEIGVLTDSPIGFYHFVEGDQVTLSLQAWSTRTLKEFCKADGKGKHYPIDQAGLWADCIREKRPLIHNDYSSLTHRKGFPEGHAAVVRELVVPIMRSGDVVAVLGIGNKPTDYTDKDLHVVSYLADVAWEITSRKRAEQALKESEDKYRTLFEDSIDGVYSVVRDGAITDANTAFCNLFGYTSEEMIGKDIRELYFDPTDRAKFQEDIEERGFVKDYEVKFQKKDGTEVDCLISSSVHLGNDGIITGYRGILRDLTARKALQSQLLQAQKMEAIGTLAGGVAHDFNNILQVALGYSELLLAGKTAKDPDYDDLQKINHAARSGADLVRNLLTFSRKVEPKPVPMDLNSQVQKVEKLLHRVIPRMIDIRLELADDLKRINADPGQIEQIIMNLSVNARDAMGDKGCLTFRAEDVTLGEEYCKLNVEAKPGDYVLLSVTDTGHGMDKDTLQHIFEPFYTTKELGRGTGLGLAMVYGIVKQHGGHIDCYSEVGNGTTFKLYFPAIPSVDEADLEETDIIPALGTETLLMVDDEEYVRGLGERILKKSGYRVLTAANGEEALAVYSEQREQISLVLLDLIMPSMGGKDCLLELLKINPALKVLIASGYAADETTTECIKLGAAGFVAKPYRFKELLQQVRKTLDES